MDNLISLILYFLVYILGSYFISYGIRSSISYRYIYIGFFILLFWGAFRYGVGADYFSYAYFYEKYRLLSWQQIFSEITGEFGYKTIIKLVSYIDYLPVYYGFYCFVILYMFYKFIKEEYSNLPLFLVFFIFLLDIYTVSFNIMRQGIAIVIALYSSKFIIKRDFLRFVLFIFLAFSFHMSVLFFLPAYFFPQTTSFFSYKKIFIIVITVFLAFSISEVISSISDIEGFERYASYASHDGEINNRSVYLSVVLTGIFLLFYKQLVMFDKRSALFVLFSITGIILMFTGFISPFVKRCASYYSVFNILLCGMLIRAVGLRLSQLAYLFIIFFMSFKFTITYYFLKQSSIIPYKCILFYSENYEN